VECEGFGGYVDSYEYGLVLVGGYGYGYGY
jgi:hypothetical protein